jgi:hypothetical protein
MEEFFLVMEIVRNHEDREFIAFDTPWRFRYNGEK